MVFDVREICLRVILGDFWSDEVVHRHAEVVPCIMDRVDLPPWILLEEENDISYVVKDVPEVVDRVHDVVFGVVAVLHRHDVVEVGVDILAGVPAMESDWMQLLGDFGHQEGVIKDVVNVLKDIFGPDDHTSHVHDLISIKDEVILN